MHKKKSISKEKQQKTVVNLVTSMLAKAITTKCHMYRGKQNEQKTNIVAIANITRQDSDITIDNNIENEISNDEKINKEYQVTKIKEKTNLQGGTKLNHLMFKKFGIKSEKQGNVRTFTVKANVVEFKQNQKSKTPKNKKKTETSTTATTETTATTATTTTSSAATTATTETSSTETTETTETSSAETTTSSAATTTTTTTPDCKAIYENMTIQDLRSEANRRKEYNSNVTLSNDKFPKLKLTKLVCVENPNALSQDAAPKYNYLSTSGSTKDKLVQQLCQHDVFASWYNSNIIPIDQGVGDVNSTLIETPPQPSPLSTLTWGKDMLNDTSATSSAATTTTTTTPDCKAIYENMTIQDLRSEANRRKEYNSNVTLSNDKFPKLKLTKLVCVENPNALSQDAAPKYNYLSTSGSTKDKLVQQLCQHDVFASWYNSNIIPIDQGVGDVNSTLIETPPQPSPLSTLTWGKDMLNDTYETQGEWSGDITKDALNFQKIVTERYVDLYPKIIKILPQFANKTKKGIWLWRCLFSNKNKRKVYTFDDFINYNMKQIKEEGKKKKLSWKKRRI